MRFQKLFFTIALAFGFISLAEGDIFFHEVIPNENVTSERGHFLASYTDGITIKNVHKDKIESVLFVRKPIYCLEWADNYNLLVVEASSRGSNLVIIRRQGAKWFKHEIEPPGEFQDCGVLDLEVESNAIAVTCLTSMEGRKEQVHFEVSLKDFSLSRVSRKSLSADQYQKKKSVSATEITKKIKKIAVEYLRNKKLPLDQKVEMTVEIGELIRELRPSQYSYYVKVYLHGKEAYALEINTKTYRVDEFNQIGKAVPVRPNRK